MWCLTEPKSMAHVNYMIDHPLIYILYLSPQEGIQKLVLKPGGLTPKA